MNLKNNKYFPTADIFNSFDRMAGAWSENYYGSDFRSHNFQERRDKVLSLLDMKSCEMCLDAGCGSGDFLRELKKSCKKIYGFDGASRMIFETRKKYADCSDIHLFAADVEKIPVRERVFDAIVCVGVLEYLADDSSSLSELYRILKDGGSLVITLPNMLSPFMILDDILLVILRAGAWFLDNLGIYKFIMGRRRLENRELFHKRYNPWRFRQLLRECNFKISAESWCTFGSMILGKYLPFSVSISRHLGVKSSVFWKFLALNYIVKVKK